MLVLGPSLLLMSFLAAGCASSCPEQGLVGSVAPAPADPVSVAYAPRSVADGIDVGEAVVRDESRDRTIRVRIYRPRAAGRYPLIIFSHGLGSSRFGYQYLGEAWAKAGYVVIHLQHPDSDASRSLIGLYFAAFDEDVWRNRPLDVSFVIDAVRQHRPELGATSDFVDPDRTGVAGHSYGAFTALVIAGTLIDYPEQDDVSLADPRVDAAISLSSPRMRGAPDPASYSAVSIPVLHMTGTNDSSRVFRTRPCHRRTPFEWIERPDQILVTMERAVHGSFSDGAEAAGPDVEKYHRIVVMFTTAFWDATLKGDESAANWLAHVRTAGVAVERKA